MKFIFAFSGPKEGDGHILPLVKSKVSNYLCSYYYLRHFHPEQIKSFATRGMPIGRGEQPKI